jgi:hypothetical protein
MSRKGGPCKVEERDASCIFRYSPRFKAVFSNCFHPGNLEIRRKIKPSGNPFFGIAGRNPAAPGQ